MGKPIKAFFCGAALLAFVPSYLAFASSAQHPFSITISTAQNSFKSGSEIRLQVVLTNTSDHSFSIGRAIDGTSPVVAGYLFEIHVDNEKGNSPPETKYERALRGNGSPEDLPVSSGIGMNLSAGQSSKDALAVNKFYDLSEPGKYKIQVQWTNPTSKIVVKSNTITVTVTP
jgi:hypothetical protein